MIEHFIESYNLNEKIREILEIQNQDQDDQRIFSRRQIVDDDDNFNIDRFMTKRETRMKIEFQQVRVETRATRAKAVVVKKNIEIVKLCNGCQGSMTIAHEAIPKWRN